MFLRLSHLGNVVIEFFLHLLNNASVLLANFRDEHLVVAFAAVLQEDSKDSPKGREEDVFVVRAMMKGFLKHFIETN